MRNYLGHKVLPGDLYVQVNNNMLLWLVNVDEGNTQTFERSSFFVISVSGTSVKIATTEHGGRIIDTFTTIVSAKLDRGTILQIK
jgi:hypothetical protein